MLNRFGPVPASVLSVALAAAAPVAQASCGSAFCTLMTDRYALGTEVGEGWTSDLRLERVTQTQLRSGTRNLAAAEVTGEEAIERHTRNTNLVESLGYGFASGWSLSLRLPLVRRDHLHDLVDEQTGEASTPEQWRFTKPGDLQVLARRPLTGADSAASIAVFGGLKLPPGSTRVTNADGVRAERALQPGSGTTDVVAGVAVRRGIGLADAAFAQLSLSRALDSHEGFRPGQRLELAAGWSHAWTHEFGAVLQLNLRQRGRDRGAQAEPEQSGSTTVDLSPGVTVGVGPSTTIYAYLQRPLYQKVNGIQLVPRGAFAIGWTNDF